MAISYEERLPGPALGGVVTSFWCVSGDGARVPAPAILPDDHVELVFNLGDPVLLAGRAFRGEQPDRAIVGPLSHAVRLEFGISTDDCMRDYTELKRRGARFDGEPQRMPFGTGVMMEDLYGNKIYLNQDPG